MGLDAKRPLISALDSGPDQSSASLAPGLTANVTEIFSGTEELISTSEIIRALDSPLRIRLLVALHERDHFVHELVRLVGSSQPLVSQHLKVLKTAGLVEGQRQGRQMIYSLAQPLAIDILRTAAKVVRNQPDA